MVVLGLLVLFSEYRVITSSGIELGTISNAPTICLVFILLTSSNESKDFKVFLHDKNQRRSNFREDRDDDTKGKFFKVYLKDVFGLTEHKKSYLWLELESIDENE